MSSPIRWPQRRRTATKAPGRLPMEKARGRVERCRPRPTTSAARLSRCRRTCTGSSCKSATT
eukprot:1785624-Amphidinium_carterae.1